MMALSNWDSWSMDEKGNPRNGVYKSPLGVTVEIYKNWIYVRDEVGWQEHPTCHQNNVVMEIHKSDLHYKDVHVVSDTVDGTVYIAVWSGWEHKNTLTGMVGIGTYGFEGDEYIGVRKEQLEQLHEFLCSKTFDYSIPDIFKNMGFKEGKRFNQGDMFFHKAVGTPTQCSGIGEAKPTIFSQVLNGMNDGKDEEKKEEEERKDKHE